MRKLLNVSRAMELGWEAKLRCVRGLRKLIAGS
jgi:hypothetical protein